MELFTQFILGMQSSVPDRDRLWATRLRLSSHRLAIETGIWSRIPRYNRMCSCGAIQTEEHVICFCPLSRLFVLSLILWNLRAQLSSLTVPIRMLFVVYVA